MSPSSNWLVATVVPWLTALVSPCSAPSRPSALCTPARKPSAGSFGVDGVFVATSSPDTSSRATTSVNVPPVSIPILIRRATQSSQLVVGDIERRRVLLKLPAHVGMPGGLRRDRHGLRTGPPPASQSGTNPDRSLGQR